MRGNVGLWCRRVTASGVTRWLLLAFGAVCCVVLLGPAGPDLSRHGEGSSHSPQAPLNFGVAKPPLRNISGGTVSGVRWRDERVRWHGFAYTPLPGTRDAAIQLERPVGDAFLSVVVPHGLPARKCLMHYLDHVRLSTGAVTGTAMKTSAYNSSCMPLLPLTVTIVQVITYTCPNPTAGRSYDKPDDLRHLHWKVCLSRVLIPGRASRFECTRDRS